MFHFRKRYIPLVLLIGAGSLIAGCRRGHCGPSDEKYVSYMVDKAAKKLAMNPQQKSKLDSLMREGFKRMQSMRAHRGVLKSSLIASLRSEKTDTLILANQAKTIEAEWMGDRDFMLQAFATMHGELTPAQRNKLADFIESHHGPRG